MTTKAGRRRLHQGLNDLTKGEVAAIVLQTFPRAKGTRVDELAKQVIAGAHRQVSPRLPRKSPRG